MPSYHTRTGALDPLDKHLGFRVRQARIVAGLTQGALGKALGFTFQQVQKYENGHNRIGGATLWRIGQAVGQPVTFFYEGWCPDADARLEGCGASSNSARPDGGGASSSNDEAVEPARHRTALEIHRLLARMSDLHAATILRLCRVLCNEPAGAVGAAGENKYGEREDPARPVDGAAVAAE